jgi:hypothetical protein
MRKNLDGVWELEDDSSHAVRCVEETPRAAFTSDDLEAILTRAYMAVALACTRRRPSGSEVHMTDFISVWRGFFSQEQTAQAYQELMKRVGHGQ